MRRYDLILQGTAFWKLTQSWQKAEAAAQKQAEANAKLAQQEDAEWAKGAKSNAKKYGKPLHLNTCPAT